MPDYHHLIEVSFSEHGIHIMAGKHLLTMKIDQASYFRCVRAYDPPPIRRTDHTARTNVKNGSSER